MLSGGLILNTNRTELQKEELQEPVYNESFSFTLPNVQLQAVTFCVSVIIANPGKYTQHTQLVLSTGDTYCRNFFSAQCTAASSHLLCVCHHRQPRYAQAYIPTLQDLRYFNQPRYIQAY